MRLYILLIKLLFLVSMGESQTPTSCGQTGAFCGLGIKSVRCCSGYQIHVAERELFVVLVLKELTVVRDIFVISLPTIHMPDVLLDLVEFYYE